MKRKKARTRKRKKSTHSRKPSIGFVGQGYVGKHYADAIEKRGYEVVRYSLEEPYRANKQKIKDCPVVIIGVPTPTTPKGFDSSIVEEAISLTAPGATVVIKSTVLPGTTKMLHAKFPDRVLVYSPEFLSESTAAYDVANPFSNIIGCARADAKHRKAAAFLHALFPKAPYALTCDSTEAELIKYAHNGSGYVQVVFFNMMYDLAHSLGADWKPIEKALSHDHYISSRYAKPLHKSGRGAGGNCFIKDFAALRELHERLGAEGHTLLLLRALEQKNKQLLLSSGKDLRLLEGVYGPIEKWSDL